MGPFLLLPRLYWMLEPTSSFGVYTDVRHCGWFLRSLNFHDEDDASTGITLLVAAGDRSWDLVPSPCPGLEAALPAVAKAAPDELGQLFQRLEAPAQAFIRTALLSLRRVFPEAPEPVQLAILGAAVV